MRLQALELATVGTIKGFTILSVAVGSGLMLLSLQLGQKVREEKEL